MKTVDDVREFFQSLVAQGVSFHVDDDFTTYTNKDGSPCFAAEEGKALNTKMEEAYAICDAAGVDIYAIGCEVLTSVYKDT
jgi:uncharacterized protein YxjI